MSPQKGGFHKCTGAAPRQSPDSAAAAIDLILSAAKFLMSVSPVSFAVIYYWFSSLATYWAHQTRPQLLSNLA